MTAPMPRPVVQTGITVVLLRRELRSRLGSFWFFALASGLCLVAAFVSTGIARSFETETVMVSADPLAPVAAVALCYLALTQGLRLAASLAWEREHRTLDVLLAGPATAGAVVASKLLAELVTLCLLGAVYSAYVLAVQPVGSGTTVARGLAAFWTLVVLVAPMLGLGLVLSAAFATVRGAVVGFLVVTGLLVAVEGAAAWLDAADLNDLSLAALTLRGVLDSGWTPLSWVSPVAYAMGAAKISFGLVALDPLRLATAVALTLAAPFLAVSISVRKGSS